MTSSTISQYLKGLTTLRWTKVTPNAWYGMSDADTPPVFYACPQAYSLGSGFLVPRVFWVYCQCRRAAVIPAVGLLNKKPEDSRLRLAQWRQWQHSDSRNCDIEGSKGFQARYDKAPLSSLVPG